MKTCWNSILLYIVYLDKRVANVLMLITLQYKSSIIYMCVRFYRWWHGDFRFIYDNIAERVQLTWTRILYLNISKLIIKQIFHICVYTRFRNKEKKKRSERRRKTRVDNTEIYAAFQVLQKTLHILNTFLQFNNFFIFVFVKKNVILTKYVCFIFYS